MIIVVPSLPCSHGLRSHSYQSRGRYLAITLTEQPLRPGESVTLTFTFDDNVSVTLRVPMGLPSVAPPRSPIKLPSSAEAA